MAAGGGREGVTDRVLEDAFTSILLIYAVALAGWLVLWFMDKKMGTEGRYGYSVVAVVTCIFSTLSILCECLR